MSKLSLLVGAAVFALAGSTAAFAAGPGGFGPSSAGAGAPQGFAQQAAPNTVQSVINNGYDDQRVFLTGKLTNYLGHDRYEFTDNTGSIEVELDDDRDWSFIRKGELITIFGKIDRDYHSINIDVKDARPAAAAAPARN